MSLAVCILSDPPPLFEFRTMIVGLGTDLMDVTRMEKQLQEDAGLISSLFTPAEIAYCEGKRYPAQHYAARFAAKESLFKALGTGYRDGLSWLEIEISHSNTGQPEIKLTGKVQEQAAKMGVNRVCLSMSHTRTHAAATVILES
ncbi:holo-ACP synthase [candidate division KSB1 bacterium]|nr:MAG: holo-ACP synthase [candidate division KSB1 bacterium]